MVVVVVEILPGVWQWQLCGASIAVCAGQPCWGPNSAKAATRSIISGPNSVASSYWPTWPGQGEWSSPEVKQLDHVVAALAVRGVHRNWSLAEVCRRQMWRPKREGMYLGFRPTQTRHVRRQTYTLLENLRTWHM